MPLVEIGGKDSEERGANQQMLTKILRQLYMFTVWVLTKVAALWTSLLLVFMHHTYEKQAVKQVIVLIQLILKFDIDPTFLPIQHDLKKTLNL